MKKAKRKTAYLQNNTRRARKQAERRTAQAKSSSL